MQNSNSSGSLADSSTSREAPQNYESLLDIYAQTEEIEFKDDELNLMGVDKPVNYDQAAKNQCWREAMKKEIEVVEKNDTWELTQLSTGHKAIGLKWVFKIKRDTNREIIKYNARIVAKG